MLVAHPGYLVTDKLYPVRPAGPRVLGLWIPFPAMDLDLSLILLRSPVDINVAVQVNIVFTPLFRKIHSINEVLEIHEILRVQ